MLKIDLEQDEDLKNAVKIFISSLLPHDNFSPEFFKRNLDIIFRYIKLQEFQLEFRFILESLAQIAKLRGSFPDSNPILTKSVFESLLEISIGDAITRDDLGSREWLMYEGMDTDLENPVARDKACQSLFKRAIDLYDECFEMAEDSADVINHQPELEAALISCAGLQSVNTQVGIIKNGVRVGRRKLNGFKDWLKYTSTMCSELSQRVDASDNGTVSIDSLQTSDSLLSELKTLYEPIADWGIPELDDSTPILKHRLVVVVGNENVGKTKFCIDKTVNVLLEKKKVLYMCGESTLSRVYCDVIINYVWKKYNLFIKPEHILAPEDCREDVRKIIGMTIDELINNKLFSLCPSFSYDSFYAEVSAAYDANKFDFLVIDHSCALSGSLGDGSMKTKIDNLALGARNFKKAYPVCVLIASHTSLVAKDMITQGRKVTESPTKASQNLSTEADEVFILRTSETLDKQGLIALENFKRRDAQCLDNIGKYIYLKKEFSVSGFVYDEAQQAVDSVMTLDREQALKALVDDSDSEIYTL